MDFLCRLAMFLLLVLSGLCSLLLCLAHPYHFVNKPMRWIDAQAHCQEYYSDLATVEDAEDMARLVQSINENYRDSAWIGLYDDTLNSWRWSLENDTFYKEGERDFRQWWDKPDNYGGNELCTVMVFDNKWHDAPCDYTFPVICYDGREDVNETYVLIPQFMNWTDGQEYCRKHHTDLVSVRNEAEYQNVIQVLGSGIAWLGLYRTRSWSDQSNSTFTYWREGEPDNGQQTVEEGEQHCTAVSFNASGRWTDENCIRSLAFICYGDPLTFNETIPVPKTPAPMSIFTTEARTTTGLGHQGSTGLTFDNSTSSADITPSIQSTVAEYSEASTLVSIPDVTFQITTSSTTSIPLVTNTKNTSGNQSSMTSTPIPTHGTTVSMVADTTPATLSVFSATTRFSHEISTTTSTQNLKSTSTPVSTGSSTPPAESSPSLSTTVYKSVSAPGNNQTNNYTPAVRSHETTKLPAIPVDNQNDTLQLTPTLSLNQTSTGTLTPNISIGFDVTVSHTTNNKTMTIPTASTTLSSDNSTGSTATLSSTGSVRESYGSSLSPSSDASSRPFSTLSTVPNSTESSTFISSQTTTVRNGDTSSVHSMVPDQSEGSTLVSIPPSSTTSFPRVANTRNSSGTPSSMTSTPIPTRGITTVDMVGTNNGGADTTPTTLSGSLYSSITPYEAPSSTADTTVMVPTGVVSDGITDSIYATKQTQEPLSNQSTTAGSTSTLDPKFTTVPAPNFTNTTPGIIPTITTFSSPPLNQTLNHTLTSQVNVTSSQTSNPTFTHVVNSYSTLTPPIPITPTPSNITPFVTPVTNQTSNRTTTVVSSLPFTSTLDPTVFSATTRFSQEISTPTGKSQKSTSTPVSTGSSTPPAESSPSLSTTVYKSVSAPGNNQTNNYTPAVRSHETTKLPAIPVDNQNDTLQLTPTLSLNQTSTGTLTPNISIGFDVTVSHTTNNKTMTIPTALTTLSSDNSTGSTATLSSTGSVRESYGSSLSPSSDASSRPFSTLSTVPNSTESSTFISSQTTTVRNGDTSSVHSMVPDQSEGSTLVSIPPSSTTSFPRVANTRNSSGTPSSMTSTPIPTRGITTVDMVGTNNGGADTTPTTLSGSLYSSITPYEAPSSTADTTVMVPTGVVSDGISDSISATKQTQEPLSNQSITAGSTSTLDPKFTTVPAPNFTNTTPGIIPTITAFSSPPLNQTLNHTLTSQVKVTSSQTSNPTFTHVVNSYSTLTPPIPITPTPPNITPLVTPVTNQTSNRTTRFSQEISTPTGKSQKSTSTPVSTGSSTPPAEPSPTLSTTVYKSVSTRGNNQTDSYVSTVRSRETTKLPPIPVDNQNDTLQLIPPPSLNQTSTGKLTPNNSVGFDVTASHTTTNEPVVIASTPQSPGNMATVSSVGSIRELYGSSLSPSSAASSRPFRTLGTVPNSSESSTFISVPDMASQATTRSITSISLTVRNGDTFGTEASLHSPIKNTQSTTPGDSIGTATVNSTTVTGSPTSSGDIVGTTNISGTKTSAVSASKYTHGPSSTDFTNASDFTSKPTATPAHSSIHGNSSLISNTTSSVTKTKPTTIKSPTAQYTLKSIYSTTKEFKGMTNLTSSPTHLLQPTSSRLDKTDTTADQPSSPANSFFTTEPSTNSHVIGLSATLISHRPLTQSDIEELIIEQFGERLRRQGISSHITLRYIQRIEP